MPQFFLASDSLAGEQFEIRGPEAFHISKVLRFKEGRTLKLFDGHGGRYEGTISKILPSGSVQGKLTATLHSPALHPAPVLRLYQGLLKSAHWEWILQKGTELGVSVFVPLITSRSVVVLSGIGGTRKEAKQERWRKILLSAAKQSNRPALPELLAPAHFREAIQECQGKGITLLAWEGLAGTSARETLKAGLRQSGKPTVNLFVGPEGGFSEEEVELAEAHGAKLFGLGPHTLRSETAALSATSLILYELGN